MITELLLVFAVSTPGAGPGAPAPRAAPRPAAVSRPYEGVRQANLATLLLRQQQRRLQEHRAVGARQDQVMNLGLRIASLVSTRPALARFIPVVNRQIVALQRRLNVLQVSLGRGQEDAQRTLARLQAFNPPPARTAQLVRLESALRPRVETAQGRPPATPVRVP